MLRSAPASQAEAIREANLRYHNHAARHYDAKWGISFDGLAEGQVLAKVRRALGKRPPSFRQAVEVGAGTGYFSLNLARAGLVKELTCTDLSPEMLKVLRANARALGLKVKTVTAEAEALPFPARHFDLVCGHAVLHHLPHLERALQEFARVLAPGGTLLFAGEPSRLGDRLARIPKRAGRTAAPLWRTLVGAKERPARGQGGGAATAALEAVVDVHTFRPATLASLARAAGFDEVRVVGEELLANWFGWTNRALEATAQAETIPWLWRQCAYRGYLTLQALDRTFLEPALPSGLFYNLTLYARKR